MDRELIYARDTFGLSSFGKYFSEWNVRYCNQKRTAFLESQGLTVLRFTNSEVNKNIDGVMQILKDFIGKRIDVNHPGPL